MLPLPGFSETFHEWSQEVVYSPLPTPLLRAGSRLVLTLRGQSGCQRAANILPPVSQPRAFQGTYLAMRLKAPGGTAVGGGGAAALPGYQDCESADTCSCHEGQHRSIWHLPENEKGACPGQWGPADALLLGGWIGLQ